MRCEIMRPFLKSRCQTSCLSQSYSHCHPVVYLLKRSISCGEQRCWKEQLAKQVEWSTQRYFFRELNREVRLESERTQAYWERLWMGVFGGIALIGPMLLMVLHHDLNTSVITVSVATALFTLVLAIAGRDWGGKDVLAATAAYAAVLVVFVGASMTPMT